MQAKSHREQGFARGAGRQGRQAAYRAQGGLVKYGVATAVFDAGTGNTAIGIENQQDQHFALPATGDRFAGIKQALPVQRLQVLAYLLCPVTGMHRRSGRLRCGQAAALASTCAGGAVLIGAGLLALLL